MQIETLSSGRAIERALSGNPRHAAFAFTARGLLQMGAPCHVEKFVRALAVGQHRHRRSSARIAIALEVLAELEAQGHIGFTRADQAPETRVMLRGCPVQRAFGLETLSEAMRAGRGADDIARELRQQQLIAYTDQRVASDQPELA